MKDLIISAVIGGVVGLVGTYIYCGVSYMIKKRKRVRLHKEAAAARDELFRALNDFNISFEDPDSKEQK